MNKRGQIDISFGMIFSIILIIAVVGVAFYVINNFIELKKCTEIGLFYDDLKKYTNEAWQSTIHKDTFKGTLPSGIDIACFGDLNQEPIAEYRQEYDAISRAFINSKERNVFLYPIKKACDASLSSIKLEHVKTDNFFCVKVEDSKIALKTEKNQFEALVTLSP
ncbi:MAG: hypothetical protein AABX83_03885 [Nanoarchaeota archaeon]